MGHLKLSCFRAVPARMNLRPRGPVAIRTGGFSRTFQLKGKEEQQETQTWDRKIYPRHAVFLLSTL